jgi:hypothetical protein
VGRAYAATKPSRIRIATGLLGALLLTAVVAPASTAIDLAFPGYIRAADIGKLKSG